MKKSYKLVILSDMLINLLGTGIPLIVLQLIIYPLVSRILDQQTYGWMLSTMSLLYLISGTFGQSLSITRLVQDSNYKNEENVGDFNFLLLLTTFFVLILTVFSVIFYLKINKTVESILVIFTSVLLLFLGYFEVGFRLELNYRSIFWNKILSCCGYIVGFIVFYFTREWIIIFIFSFMLPLVHCLTKTDLIKEPIKLTTSYFKTQNSYFFLSLSMFLNKSLLYLDKLLIFPIMGGEAVSIYFTANIFGKLLLKMLEPITNVVLSHLSKKNHVKKSLWIYSILFGVVFSFLISIISLLLSPTILRILYPQWVDRALPLVPIAVFSAGVSSLISIINPLALKTIQMKMYATINALSLILYIALAISLYPYQGLVGYFQALLASYCFKLIILLFTCYRTSRNYE